jgi:hypothetical protein
VACALLKIELLENALAGETACPTRWTELVGQAFGPPEPLQPVKILHASPARQNHISMSLGWYPGLRQTVKTLLTGLDATFVYRIVQLMWEGKWPPLSRPFFGRNKLRVGGSDFEIRGGRSRPGHSGA